MELSNVFVVPVGVDEAWGLLTDVERIAPGSRSRPAAPQPVSQLDRLGTKGASQ